MGKNVTLKDIAEELQVSIVTVSNALAGRSGVGDELRIAIEKKAQEMGYRRKVRRERKASAKSKVYRAGTRIGVIVEDRYLAKYTSFYWEMYQRIVVDASGRGCFVSLEVLTDEQEKQGKLPLLMSDKGINGLIILGRPDRTYLKKLCQTADCPVLFLDFIDEEIPCDAVISNGYYGMYQMTNYLIDLGHTEIGFIGSYLATGSIVDRYQGFCKSLLEHEISENREWILPDRELLTGKAKLQLPEHLPTAFVCNCDFTAGMAAELLIKAGYRIPEDISLVGFDDFLVHGPMQGKLTTYAVDMDAMAHQSLKLLLKRINEGAQEQTVRVVDGKMVIRESAGQIDGKMVIRQSAGQIDDKREVV